MTISSRPSPLTSQPPRTVSVSVSVAALLPGFGSVTPAAALTVAVLDSESLALGAIVQLAV